MRHYRLLLVVVFAVVLFSGTAQHTAAASDPVKILFIGNSFSEDTSAYLRDIAKSNGKNVVVAEAHIGGIGLDGHWKNIQKNSASYRYVRYENNKYSSSRNKTLPQILRSDDWDIVFLQQNSKNSGDYSTFQPYLNNIQNYILKTVKNSTRVKIGLNGTWAYATTYHSYPAYATNQLMMYDAITNAYRKALSSASFDYYIPTGTAIQNARASDLIASYGTELTRDGIHLDLTIGRYLASLTAYKAIFGQNNEKGDYFVQPQGTEQQVILKRYLNSVANAAIQTPHAFTFVDSDDIKYTYYQQRIAPLVTKVSDANGDIYTKYTAAELRSIKAEIDAFLKRANVKRLTDSYAPLFEKIDARIQYITHEAAIIQTLKTRYSTFFTFNGTAAQMVEGRTYRQYANVLNELTAHHEVTTDTFTRAKLNDMLTQVTAYMNDLDDAYTLFFDEVSALKNIFQRGFAQKATTILALYSQVSTSYSLTSDVISKVEDIEQAKKDYDAFQLTIKHGQVYNKKMLETTNDMKIWRITFTDKLMKDIKPNHVKVVNHFGEQHDVTVEVEGEQLVITPTKPYVKDTMYYIVIDAWLRGEKSLLKQQQYITFHITA